MTALALDTPFWEERPAWLRELVDTSFAMVSDPGFKGYQILASEDYDLGEFAASDLVKTCLADHHGRTPSLPSRAFRLLDVGCGEGRFMEAMMRVSDPTDLSVVGVSAFAYNANLPIGRGFELRMLNAESLLASPDFQKDIASDDLYDCIVSAETFRHLQDPLGTLCQLFAVLRVGGVLAVDRLHVPGLRSGQLLVAWWHKVGFEVRAETFGERIAPLLLRRTSECQKLRVPVRYMEKEGSGNLGEAVYSFNEGVLEHPLHEQVLKEEGGDQIGLKESPPWCRLQCARKAPEAQWRQVESLLQRLVGR